MNSSPWPVPLLVLGVGLLVAAPWLAELLPAQAVWSDADAREFGRAAAAYHSAAHKHSAAHDRSHTHAAHVHAASAAEPANSQLAAAKAEFDRQQTRLDNARARLQFWKIGLQAAGILLAGSGIGLHLLLQTKGKSK